VSTLVLAGIVIFIMVYLTFLTHVTNQHKTEILRKKFQLKHEKETKKNKGKRTKENENE
jgi:Ca2+/H+ antiporter